MHKRFLLLTGTILFMLGCVKNYDLPINEVPDLSDPAAFEDYGVEEIPYHDTPFCGTRRNRLTVRPPNHNGLYLVEEDILDEQQFADYVVEFVLNPNRLPPYAQTPRHAYIDLVDLREGETAWRACAIKPIRSAYYRIWNEAARAYYGLRYALLPRWHKECILKEFPLRVNTAGPWIIPPPPPPPPIDWSE